MTAVSNLTPRRRGRARTPQRPSVCKRRKPGRKIPIENPVIQRARSKAVRKRLFQYESIRARVDSQGKRGTLRSRTRGAGGYLAAQAERGGWGYKKRKSRGPARAPERRNTTPTGTKDEGYSTQLCRVRRTRRGCRRRPHNTTQYNRTQHNTRQHNTTQALWPSKETNNTRTQT